MGDDLSDLKDSNAKVAQFVAATARVRAPKRSGRLAATIRGNRAAGRATVAVGGVLTPYARPIHWGWPARGIAAQPFVSEAAQETEPVWVGIYRAEVQELANRVERTT